MSAIESELQKAISTTKKFFSDFIETLEPKVPFPEFFEQRLNYINSLLYVSKIHN